MVITAPGLSSRCLDTVLPLDPARAGRESEVDCTPLPHYNPINSACHLNHIHTATASTHTQATQKAMWRWAGGEAAGEETLEAVHSADLHTGGLVLYGRFPQE